MLFTIFVGLIIIILILRSNIHNKIIDAGILILIIFGILLLEKLVVYLLEDDGLRSIITTAIICGFICATILIISESKIDVELVLGSIFYTVIIAIVLGVDKLCKYYFNFENSVRIGESKIIISKF